MNDSTTVGAAIPAATPTPSFHAWSRLPLDLKIMVLENLVHRTQPITHRFNTIQPGSAYFLTLLHVSKSFRHLAYRVHYSKGVILERARGFYRAKANQGWSVEPGFRKLEHVERGGIVFSTNAYTFQHPKAGIAVFIRRLELRLTIGDDFELWTANPGQICFLRPPVGFNEWFLLLRHKAKLDHERYAEWQCAFSNVETLTLVLNVRSATCSRDSNTRLPGRCFDVDAHPSVDLRVDRKRDLLGMFKDTKILLKPTEVEVVVNGLTCDGYDESLQRTEMGCEHGCSRLIADVVKKAVTRAGNDVYADNKS